MTIGTLIQRLWTPPKWPKRLVIVRHGESEQNLTDAVDLPPDELAELLQRMRNTRDADIALSEKGSRQAKETGRYLADHTRFDICFSSPYRRALHTAQAIITQFPYSIKIYNDDRLREKEFGLLHGLKKNEIIHRYPHEHEVRKREGKYYYRLPGGENYPDVAMRVHSFADKLARDYGGKRVLAVTHHVPVVLFRAMFEHLTERQVLDLGDVHNCGISTYALDRSKVPEGRMKLAEWNWVAYH